MISPQRYINLFLLGVFFLSFATSAFLVFGNIGQTLSLFLGFSFLVYLAYICNATVSYYRFVICSVLLYLIFLFIGWINDQNIFRPINLIFGLVSICLLNIGYLLSQNLKKIRNNGYKVDLFISIMSLVGVVSFVRFQSNIVYEIGESTRGFGQDSEINPVQVAYVNGLLFLINFSLYQMRKGKPKIVSVMLLLAQFATFLSMVMTLSRGATLFLFMFLFIYFFYNLKLNKKFVNRIINLCLIVFVGIVILSFLSSSFPLIQSKLGGLENRFLSIFDSVNDRSVLDASAQSRVDMYDLFFSELNNIILFGQKEYKPYPHNQFMEIIMRWGIVGLPLLIFSIYTFLKSLSLLRYYSQRGSSTLILCILALFIFSYLQSMTSLSLEMNRLMWLGFGFIYGLPIPNRIRT